MRGTSLTEALPEPTKAPESERILVLPDGSSARASGNTRGAIVVVVTVLAAFGPYLSMGLRTEQLAVYALFITVAVVAAPTMARTSLRGATPWRLIITWAFYLAIAAATSLGRLPQPPHWPQGNALAGADNLASPLVTMLLVWLTVDPRRAQAWLELAAKVIAVAMAGNGLLALASTQIDLTGLLRRFWTGGTGETIAQNAAAMGRFSGIFNQPAEAGAAYGIAGLCAWYVWRQRPSKVYAVLVPIVLGGLVTVSKVFILGALPMLVWLVWRSRGGSSRLGLVLISSFVTLGVGLAGFAQSWTGFSYLTRLLSPGHQNTVAFFTAGRIGSGSTLLKVLEDVTRISPISGVGLRGLSVAYDNGWVEAYVYAGLFGAACYSVTLVWLWLATRRDGDTARKRFLLWMTILAAGGSLGLPVFTANRVSTLFWIMCGLAVAASRPRAGNVGAHGETASGFPEDTDLVGSVGDPESLPRVPCWRMRSR